MQPCEWARLSPARMTWIVAISSRAHETTDPIIRRSPLRCHSCKWLSVGSVMMTGHSQKNPSKGKGLLNRVCWRERNVLSAFKLLKILDVGRSQHDSAQLLAYALKLIDGCWINVQKKVSEKVKNLKWQWNYVDCYINFTWYSLHLKTT